MAGHYNDEEYGPGPYRPGAGQFDTMNLGPGPQRVEQFDTANLGPAPYRASQFDTVKLEAPVRAQEPDVARTKPKRPTGGADDDRNAVYCSTDPASGGGETPIVNPALETQSTPGGGGRFMHPGLVIASLCLRIAAAVSLVIAGAVIASNSQTIGDDDLRIRATFASFPSNKYAVAVAIIGAVYSIYETISVAVRLAMRHPLLPGNISLVISYVGDQVVLVLLLSGASAAATTLTDLNVLYVDATHNYCDYFSSWCKQGAGGVAIILVGFCVVAASLVISSYCFYTGRY